jgi:hypothetical protein
VTSGGGGAFLHPTHQLETDVSIRWNRRRASLTLGKKDKTSETAVYPSFEVSRRLLWRNLWFAITNWDFSILMGAVYFLVGILVGLRDYPDIYVLVSLAMGAGIIGYTAAQENVSLPEIYRTWRKRRLNPDEFDEFANDKLRLQFQKALIVLGASVIHVAAHVIAAIVAARWFAAYNINFDLSGEWYSVWKWLGILGLEMGAVGFLIGSTIFGLNMLLSCRWLRMNRNDAFSALRIGRFNNFLRLCIRGDEVQVYAVGLENVPRRKDWNDNPKYKVGNPDEPRWVPTKPLEPHLIEKFAVSGKSGLPSPPTRQSRGGSARMALGISRWRPPPHGR